MTPEVPLYQGNRLEQSLDPLTVEKPPHRTLKTYDVSQEIPVPLPFN
jgi:hypothetical protein